MLDQISYTLLTPVRTLRRELGLTPNDLAVLTALISFLPRDKGEKPSAPNTALTIVFPSNEAISERTNGLDERTIRRCIARLIEAGLIARKTSANGKRFPLRYGGMIRDAFGFDLAPLAKQKTALIARARQATEISQGLQSLRAKALSMRVAAMHQVDLTEEQLAYVIATRNILRRATLTVAEIANVIDALQQLLDSNKPRDDANTDTEATHEQTHCVEETQHLPARSGQNVRHIESTKKEFIRSTRAESPRSEKPHATVPSMNKNPASMAWEEFTHVASFYPNPPNTEGSLTRTIMDIGKMLRITQAKLLRAIKTSGPGRMLLAFNYLLARAEDIRDPGPYFDKMMGV